MRLMKTAILILLSGLLLTACGSGGSSSIPTTIPTTETIFYSHALAFHNSTTVAWGYGGFGQLGTGNLGNQSKPTVIAGLSGGVSRAVGANFSVFCNGSTARSWGHNNVGQLGTGTGTGSIGTGNTNSAFSALPVKVFIPSKVTRVAAGGTHGLALGSDGRVWVWGGNDAGQLATGTPPTFSADPQIVFAQTSIALGDVKEIAAGGSHSLVLKNDGTVWAWGNNANGQIGQAPPAVLPVTKIVPITVPTQVVFGTPPQQVVISHIAAAGAFNLAIDASGNVWAWGYNGFGQLGNGSIIDSPTPVQVKKGDGSFLTTAIEIAAGLDHGLARLADGTVWAWGFNGFGQLGNNNLKVDSSLAVPVFADASKGPLFISSTNPAVSVLFAFGHTSQARDANNILFSWGDNTFGQVGNGGTEINQPFPVRVVNF